MCSLKVRFSQNLDKRNVFTYALLVEVVEAKGMSPKIFVYHQMPVGIEGNSFAEFDHVATPVDLQEIPEDAASEIVPWYRTDKCLVWFRSIADMRTGKQLFVDDISWLQKTFNELSRVDDFKSQSTIEFSEHGVREVASDEGDGSESSSDSSSPDQLPDCGTEVLLEK